MLCWRRSWGRPSCNWRQGDSWGACRWHAVPRVVCRTPPPRPPTVHAALPPLYAGRGDSQCLAVLHPRKLTLYLVQAVGPAFLQLSALCEHQLERAAANMAVGGFGGHPGLDALCVQSLDGQVSFFVQVRRLVWV